MSVGRAIRSWPHILGCSTSMLTLMVKEIGELGIRNKKLGQVISRSPQLLIRKPQEFLQVANFCSIHIFTECYKCFPYIHEHYLMTSSCLDVQ